MRYLIRLLISNWLFCLLLTTLLLAGSLVDLPLLRRLDLELYDQLMILRSTTVEPGVVLLTVDQQSRAERGDNLATRAGQSQILKKLQQLGVSELALLTPLSFPTTAVPDQALARLLAELKPIIPVEPVYSATTATKLSDAAFPAAYKQLATPQQLLLARQNPLAEYRFGQPATSNFLSLANVFPQSLPVGHLIFASDCDGKIRRHPLLLPSADRLLPSLPLQLLIRQQQTSLQRLNIPPAGFPGKLQIGNRQISVDHDYQLLLDLSGKRRSFLQYSVAQLLAGELDERKLDEKTVLLGSSEDFAAQQPLAIRGPASTSELAALATATLFADAAPRRPDWGWQLESLVLLYFLGLLLLLVPRLSNRAGFLTIGLFYLTWLAGAIASLVIYGYWLQVTPALLLCTIGYLMVRRNAGKQLLKQHLTDNHRQLAISFQEQGRLEQALEKFLQFKPKDQASKEMLYNLGLDFERKRMPHKALTAYRHLLATGRFRDSKERIKQLEDGGENRITPKRDATLILDRPGEKPTLGRYRVEKELGQGAMGTVYLGVDPKINRQVAIKTLAYSLVDPDQLESVKERFFREAEAAGRLNHPKIVTIYDVGEEKDLAYLAMELLDGKDLSYHCQAKQLLEPTRAIQICKQIAQALDYAHRQGVVHRDIKPANIMMLENGQIKVADFGVARVISSSQTETGLILGTPSYMSPEQVAGQKVDGRSDLFSLGVVMYELLSGEKPFQGESMGALMYNIANCKHRPLKELRPQLPDECQAIVAKLLQKTVNRRFKDAGALAVALEQLQQRLENG